MIDASERIHWSGVGPMWQSGTIVEYQGSHHCRQPETNSPYAYASIPAICGPKCVDEIPSDECFDQEAYPKRNQEAEEGLPTG